MADFFEHDLLELGACPLQRFTDQDRVGARNKSTLNLVVVKSGPLNFGLGFAIEQLLKPSCGGLLIGFAEG